MLTCIFRDEVWLTIYHVILVAAFIYALCRELKPSDATVTVKRGEQAWTWFVFTWGILSLVSQQILRVSVAAVGFKVLLSLVDLAILAFLCFYSDWFRNRLIALSIVVKDKEEKN